MKFNAFNLKNDVIKALDDLGYVECTKVQELVIPKALKNKNLLVQSTTGSGKTHSFLVPIINKIDLEKKNLQCLIISPTRELAKQTYDFAMQFKNYIPNLDIKLLIGGKDKKKDDSLSNNPPHILIGTPGRMNDVLKQQSLVKLGEISIIIFDEADMMLEMGYFKDIHNIISNLKDDAQMMVFSATYPQKLESDLKKYITADAVIKINDAENTNQIKHFAIDRKHKSLNEVTVEFLKQFNPYFTLIFCSKKTDVTSLHEFLINNGINAGIVHGDLSSRERKNAMKEIRSDKYQVVVCSDMAARGIDLKDVTCVLNYDLPNNTEFYFHRAGRTGRLYNKGECYSFYNVDDADKILKLEKLGIHFSYLVFKNSQFEEAKEITRKKVIKKTEEQLLLEKEIKKATSMARSDKVKPNYKKKVKLAADKVKKIYKRKKIKESIKKQLQKQKRGN